MAEPMERLQILVTPEQRRRLTVIASQRGEPVTALIREAIDSRFPPKVNLEARRAAARFLLDRPKVPYLPPEELDALLDDRFDVPE
ncbi:MAG TPA: antitoxin [Mycobacteriales bacterium]|nr:antitoxin [Mycobacteriales bacterium]